jgi:hypothetical protein
MAREVELMSRVQRLLNGGSGESDLSALFLRLRERCYGIASVREIGDFIAHSEERKKGPVTEEAREFFGHLRIMLPGLKAPIDLSNVPVEFASVATANLGRVDTVTIRIETGLGRHAAHAALKAALGKFGPGAPGRLRQERDLSEQETTVLRCALRHAISRPAFTDESLHTDFLLALEKNNLIDRGQKRLLRHLKEPLALHAIAWMHQTEVVLDDNWRAQLFGGFLGGSLIVSAIAAVVGKTGGPMIASTILQTSLRPTDWCSADLIQEIVDITWHCPIEVNQEPKLVRLGRQ